MSECLLCTGALGKAAFPYATRFNGRRYEYRACKRCGSSTLDPLPSGGELAAMYRQNDYHDVFYEEEDEQISSLLKAFVPNAGNKQLLDFGCGAGQFLKSARELGWAAEGVELDPVVRRRAAEASGCPVSSLEETKSSGKRFDLIHLGDVLEHLPAPVESMRELEALLRDGGRFLVEGPLEANASLVRAAGVLFGGVRRRLGRMPEGSYAPYHLFQTNARAQRAFFERRLGYAVERFEVWETGWPYLASSSRVRNLIGRAAVTTAKAAGRTGHMGNRFAALVRPPA